MKIMDILAQDAVVLELASTTKQGVLEEMSSALARAVPELDAARLLQVLTEREALQTFMDETQKDVTGTVRLKLYKGSVSVAGRRSPRSLYREDVVTFEADSVYRQKDAEGFIRLSGLRLRIRALRDRTPGSP